MTDHQAWRALFGLAHLAALVALVPLGLVLVRYAFRQAAAMGDPGIGGVLRRYRGTALVLLAVLVAVAITLVNFEDGPRWLRQASNLVTVALVLALVVRYMRWSRPLRGGPPPQVI